MRLRGTGWFKPIACLLLIILLPFRAFSQRYLSELDSSLFIRDTVRPLIKRFENLRFSGYFQGQYQVASTNGALTFGGGDFAQYSRTRFMIRRARIKTDYLALSKEKHPQALFTFQIDATERTVRVRDMFIRVFETKKNNFSLTTGLFARPFGYEVNLASAYRESPERGRMSQILVPSERDLGAMLSYEPQKPSSHIRIDAGIFNGPGLSGTGEFDNVKDIIGRIMLKPLHVHQWEISGGLSCLQGGWRQVSKYVYKIGRLTSGETSFVVDSVESNIGKTAPRTYYGADLQLKWHHRPGATEIRAEYWTGRQSGTATSTLNPGTLPLSPTYIRKFNGAFFYFIQDIISPHNQLLIKYDWYDPDMSIKGGQIGLPGTLFTEGDIKYTTLGFGVLRDITDNVKLLLYYEIVKNETTQLTGYKADLKDNLLTCRLQFRF